MDDERAARQDEPVAQASSLARSPAIDVIGIGVSSGEISVYDIRADERLMRMVMQDGSIRAMSFRSGVCSRQGMISLYHP